MSRADYITNCPNCGAPLRGYGRCEYCGTAINQPLQMLVVRPGIRKLVCQTQMPLELGEYKPEAVAEYAKRDIRNKMADALKELYDLGEELDYCHVTLPVIRQNIDDMPTITPAEEGE